LQPLLPKLAAVAALALQTQLLHQHQLQLLLLQLAADSATSTSTSTTQPMTFASTQLPSDAKMEASFSALDRVIGSSQS